MCVAEHTCRTVTGTRAPVSSHTAVIPRFRAMRPVRIEFGVHLEVEAAAFAAIVEPNCLRPGADDSCHNLSIIRESGESRQVPRQV